jgi:phospholipid transport system substrate-binding protein
MKIKIMIIVWCLFLSIYSNNAFSNIDPIKFIENIIQESKPYLLKKDDKFLENVMEKYIDFNEVATWIVGKNTWIKSNVEEKIFFINELKILMLKTYSKTAYYYIDANVEFLKPKIYSDIKKNKRIQISSIMIKNNKSINITYRLIKHDDNFLVFDIIIEGISILKSLKTQYSDIIKNYGLNYTSELIKSNNMK